MQWSDEANAGFTTAKPWLKVNENYKAINVAAQRACRGWPSGTCSANAWRWGYDAERLYRCC